MRARLSRHSHVRMEAKRSALDEIATRQRAANEKREGRRPATIAGCDCAWGSGSSVGDAPAILLRKVPIDIQNQVSRIAGDGGHRAGVGCRLKCGIRYNTAVARIQCRHSGLRSRSPSTQESQSRWRYHSRIQRHAPADAGILHADAATTKLRDDDAADCGPPNDPVPMRVSAMRHGVEV